MGRAFDQRRRVSRNNLADHQVIKEHFNSRQVLLDRFAVNPGAITRFLHFRFFELLYHSPSCFATRAATNEPQIVYELTEKMHPSLD